MVVRNIPYPEPYRVIPARSINTVDSLIIGAILDMTEGTVVESHQIDFRLEADFCNMKDEARCYYRVNKGDWLPIGTVHKLYFKLDHFTGCRFGLFCYAAEKTGGSACFRDFKYYDVDEIS